MTSAWRTVLGLVFGYGLSLLLIRWVILTRRRQPASSVAWILSIVLIPYAGGVLFLFFGINRVNRRRRMRQAIRESFTRIIPRPDEFQISENEVQQLSDTQRRLSRLTTGMDGAAAITRGNSILLLNDTNVALRRIEQAIMSARHSIHLEYYIWRPDRTGRRLRDMLIKKARDGVRVRFLYDGFGSVWLTRRFLRPLIAAGAIAAPFVPGRNFRERWSINLRSHRKIVVVDGTVGFTGGMNIGDEYQGRGKHFRYWRDTHLRLTGPTVNQLQQVFVEDWFYATAEELTGQELFPVPLAGGDSALAQIISSGPDGHTREFHGVMFSAINDARQEVQLTTSYFVPTDPLQMALCTAAMRGVRVRLLLPSKSDHRAVILAGRSYYDELLEAGVEIHEYRRGMLHAKTLMVDGCWSIVGTPNFDPRSLLLNFEVGAAIFDDGLAAQLREHFEEDLKHARLIAPDTWSKRTARSIFAENFCRLFSPIL